MNTLRVECSDKRFGAEFEAMMEEKFGRAYTIKVPGPDAGVHGDASLQVALETLVGYFNSLISFDKIIITVHEDCAGCNCDAKTHEVNARKLKLALSDVAHVVGSIEIYIARMPQATSAVWTHELLKMDDTAAVS